MPPAPVPHPEPGEVRPGRLAAPAVGALEGAGGAAGEGARPRRAERLDRALAWITELPAAILLALEIGVVFAGVVSRYAFRNPLTWSDELASILFLWLAMLGAVIALRRGEHMRLTAIASRAPPRLRALLETVAALVVLVFLLLVIVPAHRYVEDEWAILTPALELHNSLRAAAIEVGAALMMVIALARLVERAGLAQLAAAVAIIAAVAAALWLARPALAAMGAYNLVVFFVALVALCVVIGVPIAFPFAVAPLSHPPLMTRVPLIVAMGRMDEGMSHLILLAVPLFVFFGALIEMTGLARAMVDFLASPLGHVPAAPPYHLLAPLAPLPATPPST